MYSQIWQSQENLIFPVRIRIKSELYFNRLYGQNNPKNIFTFLKISLWPPKVSKLHLYWSDFPIINGGEFVSPFDQMKLHLRTQNQIDQIRDLDHILLHFAKQKLERVFPSLPSVN